MLTGANRPDNSNPLNLKPTLNPGLESKERLELMLRDTQKRLERDADDRRTFEAEEDAIIAQAAAARRCVEN